MKKSLYFFALFALCCVLISQAGVSYAESVSYNYTLMSDGSFHTGDISSYNPWFICEWQFYGNIYPADTPNKGGFTTLCSTQNIDLDDWTTIGYTGNFWISIGQGLQNPFVKYFDYIDLCRVAENNWSIGTCAPPPPTITITAPTTGATITSTATDLVGEWAGIDPDIFINITLYFNSNFIGEQSVAKIISVDDWTGNFTIPLSYFGISANGQWDLKGRATYKNTQLSDMYITTDLISPVGYDLIFNVSGFHTPYTFTDFDTWYDTNVVNYDTPSAWASGMIGYLQPILEKIAEFGARIQDYLDTSTAWQRGNDIGSVFPVINAYILKINIFFGGFPLAQFFQWGILIMIGMFAIKIILKLLSFIPVIGGGG